MKKINAEAIEVIAKSTIDGNILYLPDAQLDRKLYVAVNDVLTLLGGKWNRKAKGHIFEDCPADQIENVLLTGEIADWKKELQFLPTPSALAAEICGLADITPDCDCLEPSSGTGNIAEAIMAYKPKSLVCVEINADFADKLRGKCTELVSGDFLEWQTDKLFDRVVMNPPFSKKQDIKHVTRAWELLKPGGVLVAITSPSPFFCEDKLSKSFMCFLYDTGAEVDDIDEGTFKESGTSIRTKLIKAVKRDG